MKKFMLYPHGGSGNHGCEAIVRTTMKIVNGMYENATLFSDRPETDRSVGLDKILNVTEAKSEISALQKLLIKMSHKISGSDEQFYRYQNTPVIEHADKNTLALSIGGDNYCYGWVEYLYSLNKYLRKKGVTTVLWGCSVEPSAMDQRMIDDLRGHAVINTRETISYQAMRDRGLDNVHLYPDPAFLLDKTELPLPNGFEEGNTVGINLSPLILKYEKEDGATMNAYAGLINHILDSTDMRVALIPHVIVEGNSDFDTMAELYENFKDSGRVVQIGDHNALELKGFISRCRMFIGARTHATIAAYSSHVPTFVVGYSVKARGIARDIFGSEDDMVLPVQQLHSTNQLIDAFESLSSRENELRTKLKTFIPKYAAKAANAKETILPFING
ncbi:hypothetical protein LNTAR_14522 [Lentisphaera araneosa HTCC2155]|uniref:Polysaccharide pyruvyl transferase domain-containing protein n=1 Tax=Lentisphaera araneosa HTCC2155 TaxID=313628 RepID=A6DHF6_9BACT|nr:polysaccharide pyruvyl transferase family protein [Lentisphaera araneosa]EDM29039.1 hypothetical protein LNTAR_14522 [Lentisphaera araneosa HTCC2155]